MPVVFVIEMKMRHSRGWDMSDSARIPATTDYGERALSVRIIRVSQLRRMCLILGKAKPIEQPR